MRVSQKCLFVGCGMLYFTLISEAETPSPNDCKSIKVDYVHRCGDVADIQNLDSLKDNECAVMEVNAESMWNASGLRFDYDGTYVIDTAEDDYWCDAIIKSNAAGWRVSDKKLENCDSSSSPPELSTIQKWFFSAVEWLRRYPDGDWFELIGIVDVDSEDSEFPIGLKTKHRAKNAGEFCAYANDLKGFYGNNKGSLKITIRRID